MIKANCCLKSVVDDGLPEYSFVGERHTLGGFLPVLGRRAGEGVTFEVDYRADGEVRLHIVGIRSKKRIGFIAISQEAAA